MKKKTNEIKSLAAVVRFSAAERRKGKKIVTTNGCFDIIHVGHTRALRNAKALGDILIVGINSDKSVRAIKGNNRPVVPERERAEVIAALKPVDAVFVFGDKDPRKWLAKVRPDIHAKGNDRTMDEIVERDVVERFGGKVVLLRSWKGGSTTDIIKKILRGK